MIYEYIMNNFKRSEPIFINEIPGSSKDVVRQELKRLTDSKKINRLYNGVYYIPYTTILGTKGQVSINKFIEKKYMRNGGFYTGLSLVNKYGFTSQNPSIYELYSNNATTKQRKIEVDGSTIIIYKPKVCITKKNKKELEFLNLMSIIDKYSEISGEEYKLKLKEYIKENQINFTIVKEYISLYPSIVYKNIYDGGLMNELV